MLLLLRGAADCGASPRQGGSGGGAVILHTPGTVRVTGTGGVSADGGLGGDERPGDTGVAGAGGLVLITAGALEVKKNGSIRKSEIACRTCRHSSASRISWI